MTSIVTGVVQSVTTRPLGATAARDHLPGETTLTVESTLDLDETGGHLTLPSGQTLEHGPLDPDSLDVPLLAPLDEALESGELAALWPADTDVEIVVVLDGDDDPVTASATHALRGFLLDGVRDDLDGEVVRVDISTLTPVVVDVVREEPALDATRITSAERLPLLSRMSTLGDELERADTELGEARTRLAAAQARLDALPASVESVDAPAGTVMPAGSVWRQVDGQGRYVAVWVQEGDPEGSQWVERTVTSEIIDSLDVGRLTASGAQVHEAVVDLFAARLASIIQADIGNLTVTETSTLNAVVAQTLAAQTAAFMEITAQNLAAGSVEAQHLTSMLALVTTIASAESGRRWEADADGIRLYDVDDRLLVVFPTDPEQAAAISGDLTASSLTVLDQLAIRGLVNEISKGAQVVLASGTTAPASPVQASWVWPSVSTSFGAGYEGFHPGRPGLALWQGLWWTTVRQYGTSKFSLEARNMDGSQALGQKITTGIVVPLGLTVLDDVVYVLGHEIDSWGNPTTYWVEGYNPSKTRVARWQYPHVVGTSGNAHRRPAIFNNGNSIVIAYTTYSDPAVKFRTFAADTGVSIGNTLTQAGSTALTDLMGGWSGTADTGGYRYWVIGAGKSVAYAYAAGQRVPTGDFPLPSNKILGLFYDGTRFWSHDAEGARLYQHSVSQWTSGGDSLHVASTWVDDDPAGAGIFETTVGRIVSLAAKKRAFLRVTVPPLPLRSTPTTPDDPIASRVYLARAATAPAPSGLRLLKSFASGERTADIDQYVTLPATAPPGASTFPASSPAQIVSADGARIALRGDGSFTLGTIVGDKNGNVTSPSWRATSTGRVSSSQSVTNAVARHTSGPAPVFTAPQSGTVLILSSSAIKSSTSGQRATITLDVRSGSTIGSGTVVFTSPVMNSYATDWVEAGCVPVVVTGLTPGATYHACMSIGAYASGVTASISSSSITIQPQP